MEFGQGGDEVDVFEHVPGHDHIEVAIRVGQFVLTEGADDIDAGQVGDVGVDPPGPDVVPAADVESFALGRRFGQDSGQVAVEGEGHYVVIGSGPPIMR